MGKSFIAVGENIHCTRVLRVGGDLVKDESILYTEAGIQKRLPIPRPFLEASDWENGRVKHAAVAMWQGMRGNADARQAGVDYLRHLALTQQANGASFLDLNVDEFSSDLSQRLEVMRWAAGVVQEACDLPLSIDSSSPEVLEAGLAACTRGTPMVNSVSLERRRAIELAAAAGAVVIAGASGEASMPSGKEDRMENLVRLVGILHSEGLKDGRIYLDPLVFPVSVEPANGPLVLEVIGELRKRFGPEIHFAPGLSNISYGMPNRRLINQVFTWLCIERGLDGGIVDPAQINERALSGLDTRSERFRITRAFIEGEDAFGVQFMAAVRAGKL